MQIQSGRTVLLKNVGKKECHGIWLIRVGHSLIKHEPNSPLNLTVTPPPHKNVQKLHLLSGKFPVSQRKFA
jgi:hypothetical protein